MRHLILLPFLLAQTETELVRDKISKHTDFEHYKIEHRLWDRTRVDLFGEYAVEVDWAPKWAEAIGQSLYYSAVTGRLPGIVLMIRKDEERFAHRCQTVCSRHGIRLWVWDHEKGRMR